MNSDVAFQSTRLSASAMRVFRDRNTFTHVTTYFVDPLGFSRFVTSTTARFTSGWGCYPLPMSDSHRLDYLRFLARGSFPPYTRAFPPRAPPCMPRCLSSCVAVSAKQSTIIMMHTSVRAEDCSRSSAGAYRSRDNLPHAITVCVRQPRSERPERMKVQYLL